MKISPLYGTVTIKPEFIAKIVVVKPPLWIRLWYGFKNKLYEIFLILMIAVAFTGITQAPLIGEFIYMLVTSP